MFLARYSETIKLLNTCDCDTFPPESPLILLFKLKFSLLRSSSASMSSFFSAEVIIYALAGAEIPLGANFCY